MVAGPDHQQLQKKKKQIWINQNSFATSKDKNTTSLFSFHEPAGLKMTQRKSEEKRDHELEHTIIITTLNTRSMAFKW